MAVTFTNNWKNILDKVQSTLRSEFGGSAPVFIGSAEEKAGSQYFRLEPIGSDLLELATHLETREFSVNIFYHFDEENISKTTFDHILRFVSRIEALLHDNITLDLADSTIAYNCRIESCLLDVATEDQTGYITIWDWKCNHTGNTA